VFDFPLGPANLERSVVVGVRDASFNVEIIEPSTGVGIDSTQIGFVPLPKGGSSRKH
jgi:hypothetical protein